MWLQSIKEIVENVKGNDDRETIITKELKSHLKGLIQKGRWRKERKKGPFNDYFDSEIFTSLGSFRQKKRYPPSERERLTICGKKLLNPDIKRITNFYSDSERKKLTNNSHRNLLAIYIYSIVPTTQGDSLLIVHVIHDLINKHNGGCMHHSLS